jgi:magnesium chelatase subunit I
MKKYSQIVRHSGNLPLFDILDVSVAGTLTGIPIHVHAEGLRGTGKTTIIRAYKEVLPKINRIKGCLYNCDPLKPHCPQHRNLTSKQIEMLGIEQIDMPFLEISPSAKKGTVVGSIDLKRLTSKDSPEASLILGTIPKAHRGIVFVDEINRIADTSPEIVDLLLDVMGTKPGRIQIEEAGLPITEIPVQVSVWSASNPDEEPGPLEDIRRQLSDRFDFTVNVERPKNTRVIKEIISSNISFDDNISTTQKTMQFVEAQNTVEHFEPTEDIKTILSSMYVDYNIESLRCIEACLLGIKIRSALLRQNPSIDDIIFVTRYALRHRVDVKDLNNILKNLEQKKISKEKAPTLILPPAEQIDKPHNSLQAAEIKKDKNKRSSTFNFHFVKNMLRRFAENFKSAKSEKSIIDMSNSNPKNFNLKAPPQKAVPIKKLDITEYVKTEEELRR